jgi:monofunctional biosynthetic peptidoglycan transglycosylase
MKRNDRHRFAGRRAAAIAVSFVLIAGSSAMAETRKLYDFEDAGAGADWMAIHDVVMGGVSSGGMKTTDDGTAIFAGRVSLENNGGFASIRSRPAEWDLEAYSGVEVRVRGDGRIYKLNLKTDTSFDGVQYRTSFVTREGEWQTLRIPFTRFQPSFRGRPVPQAPPLDPARIISFGVLISDKQDGPFRLEIDWIAAYSE